MNEGTRETNSIFYFTFKCDISVDLLVDDELNNNTGIWVFDPRQNDIETNNEKIFKHAKSYRTSYAQCLYNISI